VVHLEEDELFDAQTVNRVALNDEVLANCFHGKQLTALLVLYKVNLAESALANLFDDFIIFKSELILLGSVKAFHLSLERRAVCFIIVLVLLILELLVAPVMAIRGLVAVLKVLIHLLVFVRNHIGA